jgi:hypothetical protein
VASHQASRAGSYFKGGRPSFMLSHRPGGDGWTATRRLDRGGRETTQVGSKWFRILGRDAVTWAFRRGGGYPAGSLPGTYSRAPRRQRYTLSTSVDLRAWFLSFSRSTGAASSARDLRSKRFSGVAGNRTAVVSVEEFGGVAVLLKNIPGGHLGTFLRPLIALFPCTFR